MYPSELQLSQATLRQRAQEWLASGKDPEVAMNL